MKSFFRIVLCWILLLAICFSLYACTKEQVESDDWIQGEVNLKQPYAKPAKDTEEDSAAQSGERIDLPTIPLD